MPAPFARGAGARLSGFRSSGLSEARDDGKLENGTEPALADAPTNGRSSAPRSRPSRALRNGSGAGPRYERRALSHRFRVSTRKSWFGAGGSPPRPALDCSRRHRRSTQAPPMPWCSSSTGNPFTGRWRQPGTGCKATRSDAAGVARFSLPAFRRRFHPAFPRPERASANSAACSANWISSRSRRFPRPAA